MKIKCNQIREGGTEIPMGEVTYHFAPNEAGDHVAEVTDEAHIARFLDIGFEEVGAEDEPGNDVSKLGKEELLALAAEHGITLNAAAPAHILRKQLAKALA